jgi:hypothetical protein
MAAYKGWSGADMAEAPAEGLTADLFCLVAAGADREASARWARERWVAYAQAQRERVEKAAKIRHGPRSGQSVIEHKWVSDEHIEAKICFVFSCVDHWTATDVPV